MKIFSKLFLLSCLVSFSAFAAPTEVKLKAGQKMSFQGGQEVVASCEAPSGVSSATIFDGTTVYAGANCKNIKPVDGKVFGTSSVTVHTNSTVSCENTRYYLVEQVVVLNGNDKSYVRAMVNAEDLVFE